MRFDKVYSEYFKYLTESVNIFDDIIDSLINVLEEYGVFSNTEIYDQILDAYSEYGDSVQYKVMKSSFYQRPITEELNRRLGGFRNVPHNAKLMSNIEFLPEFSSPFKVLGATSNLGGVGLVTVSFIIGKNPPNVEKLRYNLEYVMIHELVHARQIYQRSLRGEDIPMPTLRGFDKGNEDAFIQNILAEYLQHPLELEAFAIEYNYRTKNKFDMDSFKEFVSSVVYMSDDYMEYTSPKVKKAISIYSKRLLEEVRNPDNKWNPFE